MLYGSKPGLALIGLASSISVANAAYNPSANNNIAIYWGQNSYQQPTGQPNSQQRLSYYCANSDLDVIPLAFLNVIANPTTVNFANAGDRCSVFPGTSLLKCPEIEADIQACQSTYGKTILLSIGGATYTEGGFRSSSDAVAAANKIWATFGPVQSGSGVNRPFGNAVVDGFDFDFESSVSNMVPFANQLRSLMDAAGGKKYYLSAAPQCPYPDAADGEMLNGAVFFDFIMVQFYNNYCGLQSFVPGASTQNNFNFETWDNWAHSVSKNPNVKVFLGIPGNTGAGAGYQSGSTLAAIISYVKRFSSFGGVMIWDASQVWANPGFLDQVSADLGGSNPPGPTTTTTTRGPTSTMTTITRTTTTTSGGPTPTLVPQWGQCGGNGYTGSTQCAPPYKCVTSSEWWAQCQ